MSLEASAIASATEEATFGERRAASERRGRERRRGGRINQAAPRRSLIQIFAISAAGVCGALTGLMVAVGVVTDQTSWTNVLVGACFTAFALLAFILGCIEQRLVEIRLELMMANGGARQVDRRQGHRRTDASSAASVTVGDLSSRPVQPNPPTADIH